MLCYNSLSKLIQGVCLCSAEGGEPQNTLEQEGKWAKLCSGKINVTNVKYDRWWMKCGWCWQWPPAALLTISCNKSSNPCRWWMAIMVLSTCSPAGLWASQNKTVLAVIIHIAKMRKSYRAKCLTILLAWQPSIPLAYTSPFLWIW